MKENRKWTHCTAGKCTSSSKNVLHSYYHGEGISSTNPSPLCVWAFTSQASLHFEAPTSAESSEWYNETLPGHLEAAASHFKDMGQDMGRHVSWAWMGLTLGVAVERQVAMPMLRIEFCVTGHLCGFQLLNFYVYAVFSSSQCVCIKTSHFPSHCWRGAVPSAQWPSHLAPCPWQPVMAKQVLLGLQMVVVLLCA